jgi:antitoxin component YwqK of YwqJK toxin-antitoxin module
MRVNLDDTDYEAGGRLTYDGELFTGEVAETTNDGQLIALTNYFKGMEHGPSQEWYRGGQRRAEGVAHYGVNIGVARTWHANGQLASEQEFDEQGRELYSRRWDENGNLVEDKAYRPSAQ